jgi:multimeric flavodoxin WrbA
MNILVCIGSHRKNGNTARLVGLVAAQLRAIAARENVSLQVDTVVLGHRDIRLCRGCRACFDRGEDSCPLADDLPAIKARMIAADGLIVASPVYVEDVSGTLKNWIDRLAYLCHRPELAAKCVYLLTTTGAGSTGHAMRTLNTALRTWGAFIVGQAGFKMGALMDRDEAAARYEGRVARIARDLFDAIRERRFARPSFLSLMTFGIQQRYWQRKTEHSVDYDYWRARGWTDMGRTFYVPHQANAVKVAAARLASAIVARFVL